LMQPTYGDGSSGKIDAGRTEVACGNNDLHESIAGPLVAICRA
jgi:hypothetical protein